MSIEPFKKKKVKKEKEDESPTLSLGSGFLVEASGAPTETKKSNPDLEPPEPPLPPRNYNFIRDLMTGSAGRDFGSSYTYHAEPRSRHYEDPTIIKVSIQEAIRRELELCRNGHEPITFHASRILGYMRQYYEQKNNRF